VVCIVPSNVKTSESSIKLSSIVSIVILEDNSPAGMVTEEVTEVKSSALAESIFVTKSIVVSLPLILDNEKYIIASSPSTTSTSSINTEGVLSLSTMIFELVNSSK